LSDKALEKTFIGAGKATYASKVAPTMATAKRCGNMYTASLYGGLASLLSAVPPTELRGKRFSMFAYGSGMASSFFVMRCVGDTSEMVAKLDLARRLADVRVVPCEEYVSALKVREDNHNAADYTPSGSIDSIWPGGYYLEHIDAKYRRKYGRKPTNAA
jgi:hydroxymethylglutaryl-CoA synthase